MRKQFQAGAVAVFLTLFGSANIYATDKGPTVSDARELLARLVVKGLLLSEIDAEIDGSDTIDRR